MITPVITRRSPKGGGGSGSSGKSSSLSKSSSSSSSSKSIGISGTKLTASTSSKGGGKATTIPKGQTFAGRTIGGGTREEIYGTRSYGSGYPNIDPTTPLTDRDFPFGFEPLVFYLAILAGDSTQYALAISEYGYPWDTTRFGGPLGLATFYSYSIPGMYYHFYADNSTVSAVLPSITANCSSYLNTTQSTSAASAIALIPTNASASSTPDPGSVVQYFRSSSAALLLTSYNNTAAYTNGTDTPLPDGIDTQLLSCLNATIASAIPITDAPPRFTPLEISLISSGATFGAIILFALLIFCCYCTEGVCMRCRGWRSRMRTSRSRTRKPIIAFPELKLDRPEDDQGSESGVRLVGARTPSPMKSEFSLAPWDLSLKYDHDRDSGSSLMEPRDSRSPSPMKIEFPSSAMV
ncbi:hypothetical protein H0H92_012712 [Tricholoma furcatifolium]|nr:hypothetical protein H0H92_012712 [Tricholoma furcatifolium]